MTRTTAGFGALDLLILAVVGIGLPAAAVYSESIVTRASGSDEATAPPPIQWRDQFLGAAIPEPDKVWMAGSNGKILRSRR